jgi:ectoine hydroxylase-related dioxygenase (phytanoyl-CoA dioxygenase family)
VFCFVYDEFWRPFFRLDALFRHLLGPYVFLPDFWVWDVDPQRGGSGWARHRDRGRMSLREDGTPVSLTTWIAISEATPQNGCLRIVPKHLDPTYNTPNEGDWRYDEASVRMMPALPGDVLLWNQAVTHWGGKALSGASRVSMSFETQRLDVPSSEAPLMAPWQVVPFEARLKLIGQKLLHYRHMHKVTPELEALAERLSA